MLEDVKELRNHLSALENIKITDKENAIIRDWIGEFDLVEEIHNLKVLTATSKKFNIRIEFWFCQQTLEVIKIDVSNITFKQEILPSPISNILKSYSFYNIISSGGMPAIKSDIFNYLEVFFQDERILLYYKVTDSSQVEIDSVYLYLRPEPPFIGACFES